MHGSMMDDVIERVEAMGGNVGAALRIAIDGVKRLAWTMSYDA